MKSLIYAKVKTRLSTLITVLFNIILKKSNAVRLEIEKEGIKTFGKRGKFIIVCRYDCIIEDP